MCTRWPIQSKSERYISNIPKKMKWWKEVERLCSGYLKSARYGKQEKVIISIFII
jgi:hypothetical protein